VAREKVSHYRVLEVIAGCMGMVYKAGDLKLGRRVASKLLPEELAADPVALRRLSAKSSPSALNHPYICTIHGIEEYDGQSFIVMEQHAVQLSLLNLVQAQLASRRQWREETVHSFGLTVRNLWPILRGLAVNPEAPHHGDQSCAG
jgi:hypothetical protein